MGALDTYQTFFSNYPFALAALVFVLGLLVGSFLNVVIYRLPIMMDREMTAYLIEFLREAKSNPELKSLHAASEQLPEEETEPEESFNLMLPASHCPSCGHKIRAWENIPILSYLLLRGKCSNCGTAIHWRYPSVELATGLLSLVIVLTFGFSLTTLLGICLTWALIVLTMIDFDHKILPDSITLPLIWIGLLINFNGTFVPLESAVIGAIAGYMTLWTVFWVFKLLTGKDGMGYGDFKLLAALGAWMGWSSLPMIILLSSLVGAVVGLSLIIILGRDKNIPIPFGPYLAAAGWISFVWGDSITQNYLTFIS